MAAKWEKAKASGSDDDPGGKVKFLAVLPAEAIRRLKHTARCT
jgi:hypothetical protein